MEFMVKVSGNQVAAVLMGDMYVEDAATFRNDMMEHLRAGENCFEIDMTQLRYIDSSGLGVLVTMHKKAAEQGGSVTIKGLTGSVKELFELTRLDKVFNLVP